MDAKIKYYKLSDAELNQTGNKLWASIDENKFVYWYWI